MVLGKIDARIGKPMFPLEATPVTLRLSPVPIGLGQDDVPELPDVRSWIDQETVPKLEGADWFPTVPGTTVWLTRQVSAARAAERTASASVSVR